MERKCEKCGGEMLEEVIMLHDPMTGNEGRKVCFCPRCEVVKKKKENHFRFAHFVSEAGFNFNRERR